ncbi:hypothetical protein AB0G81_34220 [Streptomyces asoensis]
MSAAATRRARGGYGGSRGRRSSLNPNRFTGVVLIGFGVEVATSGT